MAWSTSNVFRAMVTDTLAGTSVFDFDSPSDTYKMAAFGTLTPDKDATSANTAYNAGVWLTAAEVIDTLNTNWVAGGRTIAGMATTNPGSGITMVDINDVTGAGNVTMTAFFGTMTYDFTKSTPVAKQGVCFNYLGGTQTISNGPITIVIDINGLFRATV